MRVRLQNNDSGQTFSDQLLANGNGKPPVDSISGRIQLPAEFCNLMKSKNELVEKVFQNFLTNYKNHKWLSERAILAAKNKHRQLIFIYIEKSEVLGTSELLICVVISVCFKF